MMKTTSGHGRRPAPPNASLACRCRLSARRRAAARAPRSATRGGDVAEGLRPPPARARAPHGARAEGAGRRRQDARRAALPRFTVLPCADSARGPRPRSRRGRGPARTSSHDAGSPAVRLPSGLLHAGARRAIVGRGTQAAVAGGAAGGRATRFGRGRWFAGAAIRGRWFGRGPPFGKDAGAGSGGGRWFGRGREVWAPAWVWAAGAGCAPRRLCVTSSSIGLGCSIGQRPGTVLVRSRSAPARQMVQAPMAAPPARAVSVTFCHTAAPPIGQSPIMAADFATREAFEKAIQSLGHCCYAGYAPRRPALHDVVSWLSYDGARRRPDRARVRSPTRTRWPAPLRVHTAEPDAYRVRSRGRARFPGLRRCARARRRSRREGTHINGGATRTLVLRPARR